VSDRYQRDQRPGVRGEGDHTTLCRGVKVKSTRQIVTPFSMSPVRQYKENVGDIHALCSNLSEKHGLPIQLVYRASGFLFSIRKGDLVDEKLPWGFTNLSMQKGRWWFTSMELVSSDVASSFNKYTLA